VEHKTINVVAVQYTHYTRHTS